MAAKQRRATVAARWGLHSGVDNRAHAAQVPPGPPEEDSARDTAFAALRVPKGGRSVRTMAPPARRYWPSANSQHAPNRPPGRKKALK